MIRRTLLIVVGALVSILPHLASTCAADVGRAAVPASAPATRPSRGPATVPVDVDLPEYQRVDSLSGTIRSVGSSPVSSLLASWGDEFKKIYPNVEVEARAGGSSLAPEALIGKDPPQLAPMGRPMSDSEVAAFKKHFGYEPTGIRVAINAVIVYVNVENPCRGLSLAELDAVVSRTFRAGHDPIVTWGQAGVGDPKWTDAPVTVHIPRKGRATYDLIKSRVLLDGEFRFDAHNELTASAILQEVAVNRAGLGIASNVFRTRRTRALPLQGNDGTFYEPTYENTVSGRYPLSTYFYVYVNKPPDKPMDRLTREFLVFACTQRAQELAANEGAYPLTPQLAIAAMRQIGP